MSAPCVQRWLLAQMEPAPGAPNGLVDSQLFWRLQRACVLETCTAHYLHSSADARRLLLTLADAMGGAAQPVALASASGSTSCGGRGRSCPAVLRLKPHLKPKSQATGETWRLSSDLTVLLFARRVDFGSYADMGPYHGWIFAYQQLTLSLTSVFCVTPNGKVRARTAARVPLQRAQSRGACNAPVNTQHCGYNCCLLLCSRAEWTHWSVRIAGESPLLPCSGTRGPLP